MMQALDTTLPPECSGVTGGVSSPLISSPFVSSPFKLALEFELQELTAMPCITVGEGSAPQPALAQASSRPGSACSASSTGIIRSFLRERGTATPPVADAAGVITEYVRSRSNSLSREGAAAPPPPPPPPAISAAPAPEAVRLRCNSLKAELTSAEAEDQALDIWTDQLKDLLRTRREAAAMAVRPRTSSVNSKTTTIVARNTTIVGLEPTELAQPAKAAAAAVVDPPAAVEPTPKEPADDGEQPQPLSRPPLQRSVSFKASHLTRRPQPLYLSGNIMDEVRPKVARKASVVDEPSDDEDDSASVSSSSISLPLFLVMGQAQAIKHTRSNTRRRQARRVRVEDVEPSTKPLRQQPEPGPCFHKSSRRPPSLISACKDPLTVDVDEMMRAAPSLSPQAPRRPGRLTRLRAWLRARLPRRRKNGAQPSCAPAPTAAPVTVFFPFNSTRHLNSLGEPALMSSPVTHTQSIFVTAV